MDESQKQMLTTCSRAIDYLTNHASKLDSIIIVAKSKNGVLGAMAGMPMSHGEALAQLADQNPGFMEAFTHAQDLADQFETTPFLMNKNIEGFIDSILQAGQAVETPAELMSYKSAILNIFEVAEMPTPQGLIEANTSQAVIDWVQDNKSLINASFESVQNES